MTNKPTRTKFQLNLVLKRIDYLKIFLGLKQKPSTKFEVVNNGKEYHNGRDQVFIIFDQEDKVKSFEAKIIR